nr:hypothetical protein [uncultured Moellerella sp.]
MSYEFVIEADIPANSVFPYQVQISSSPGTFRLTEPMVSAMISLLQIMDKLDTDDMLNDHCFDRIWLNSELTPARAEEIYRYLEERATIHPEPSEEEIASFHQAQSDQQALLSQESSKEGMIPVHKFATNDGWLVTPNECAIIAKIFSQRLIDDNGFVIAKIAELCEVQKDQLVIELAEWGKFNKFAIKQGGYCVT